MSPTHSIATLITANGAIIFLLSLPLIFKRIPPNRLYGIRTKAAFASDADWYRINTIGGKRLAVSGVLVFLTGLIGFCFGEKSLPTYGLIAAVITLLVVLIPCLSLLRIKPQQSDDAGKDSDN